MLVKMVTYDQLLQLKDYDIEFNVKLILLVLILGYACAMVYFCNRIGEETLLQQIIKYSLKIYGWIWIFFSPLFFSIFLFREVSPVDLLNFLWRSYGAILMITTIIMIFKIFTFILKPFGWEPKSARDKTRYKEDGL